MAETKARWAMQLYCTCPLCKEDMDLLDEEQFWDGVTFQAIEHETDKTTDVEVWCPECHESFKVDFEW